MEMVLWRVAHLETVFLLKIKVIEKSNFYFNVFYLYKY